MQVFPMVNITRLALANLRSLYNVTVKEQITLIVLPSVAIRPMAFVKDICILDAGIAESPPKEILMYVMQCFLQQSIIRSMGAKDESTQRLMMGIRDFFSYHYMTSTWWNFDAADYIAQRSMLLEDEQKVAVKYRWKDHNKEDLKGEK